MNIQDYLNRKLESIKKSNRFRVPIIQKPISSNLRLINDQEIIQFSSNDYLGLSKDERLIEAAINAAKEFGVGSTGSRLITGTTELHEKLEGELAKFKDTEKALFFNSGYSANLGVICSLLGLNDVVYNDELNHSSILCGVKQSNAMKIDFKHLSLKNLEEKLIATRNDYRNALIVSESVFSMDGDIADIQNLYQVSEKYDCWLMIDEAHSTGVYNEDGGGLVKQLGLSKKVDIQMGTCSKSLGVQGAYIAGSEELIEFLKQRAKTYIYSTSSSPMIIGSVLESIKVCIEEKWRREKLFQNVRIIRDFCDQIKNRNGVRVVPGTSQIICLEFEDIESCLKASKKLFEYGIWIHAVRPPTVKTPRLRISPNALHSENEIDKLTIALNDL
ncbi:MAG: pyridoxal phosphate-dependent aminotransferase family protein [Candidatus Caenarcaniphilales bacterium]|nr:pyridoxal phosphate-dependent aminotransferase family protein [Candidatus Caenarcaniphilales bacterium]